VPLLPAKPIVLYRGRSGAIHCAGGPLRHRQVALSQGMVEGERCAAAITAWRYDCAGACVDVPYLGQAHLVNGVAVYPVRDVDGMVFRVSRQSRTGTGTRAGRAGFKGERGLTRQGGSIARSPVTIPFMHENLFDMNHQFLHRSPDGLREGDVPGPAQVAKTGAKWITPSPAKQGRANMGETAIRNANGQEG